MHEMMNLRKEEMAKKTSLPAAAAKQKAPSVPMLKGAKLAMAPKVSTATTVGGGCTPT
jgi:hypothetical protein